MKTLIYLHGENDEMIPIRKAEFECNDEHGNNWYYAYGMNGECYYTTDKDLVFEDSDEPIFSKCNTPKEAESKMIEKNKRCNPFYTIFVRPPKSLVWTQHMRQCVPWRGNAESADGESVILANQGYCARVVPINLPPIPDDHPYAILADGDSKYTPAF